MKTSRIKNVRIYHSNKQASGTIPAALSRLHVQWIERELTRGNYDKETKLKVINGIIKELQLQENSTS